MSPGADSAGQPFAGRSFHANPFAGDDGLADPGLRVALERFHALLALDAELRSHSDVGAAWGAVIEALSGARVLSPLIAEAGDYGRTDEGLVVEKTQELSIVHLEGPDGRAVAPVFTDVSSMSAWRADARPIPVDARKAAVAALADGLSLMVLDPGSPGSVTLRRGALLALATGEPYQPAWRDPLVARAIEEGIAAFEGVVVKHRVLPGDPGQALVGPELVVAIGLKPGLTATELDEVITRISLAWSSNEVLSRMVDGLGMRVVPL
jgi:hypothetical protein